MFRRVAMNRKIYADEASHVGTSQTGESWCRFTDC